MEWSNICRCSTQVACTLEGHGVRCLLDADLATRLGDLSVEPGGLQGHSASLQGPLQLSSGGEPVDPARRPHPRALDPVQRAEPDLCPEPHHMAVKSFTADTAMML